MKNLFASILSLFLAAPAFADVSYSMPAVEGGFKWNSMDFDGSSSNKQTLAFQMGGSLVVNFNQDFGLKTGLFYSERTFKSDFTGVGSIDGKITYADIPLLLMFKLEDYAGLYAGLTLANKIGDECNSCGGSDLTGIKSLVTPITIGGQFKFSEYLGLNIFFETVSGKLADNIKASRGIGANLLIAFD